MTTLSARETEILGSTSQIIFEDFTLFANKMYGNFFRFDEEIRHHFGKDFHGIGNKTDISEQENLTPMARAMAHAMFHLVKAATSIPEGDSDVQRLAAKHVSRGVKKEFYPMLRNALLSAMVDVLAGKEGFNMDEVMAAWTKAYDAMSKTLMSVEDDVRKAAAEKENGWEGFRQFRVTSKEQVHVTHNELSFSDDEDDDEDEDSSEIQTVMTLEPVNGALLPSFDEGQHVCMRFQLDNYGVSHKNYTLDSTSTVEKFCIRLRPTSDRSACTRHMLANFDVGYEVLVSPPLGTHLVMESLIE